MKIYNIISLAIILFTLSSCEKEIDVKLNSVPPRIVIEGIVGTDSLAKVRVSTTKDFNNNDGYPTITGAIVKIEDDKGNSETLNMDANGWYTATSLYGVIGNTYNLSVKYEGEEYTATSKVPPLVTIDSLTMYKIPAMDYALPMIHFKDPKGTENQYYRALVFINGVQRPDSREQSFSAEQMDGSALHLVLPVFSNDDDVAPIQQDDEILIEMQCIDKGAYTFFDTLAGIGHSLTNPTSNIKGGALGYFNAHTIDRMTIKAVWKK